MTSPGPQHRIEVSVLDGSGDSIASATCFFSTWTDEDGDTRWRGCLGALDPEGAVTEGLTQLRRTSGVEAAVVIRAVRTDGREQAMFTGEGSPPPVE